MFVCSFEVVYRLSAVVLVTNELSASLQESGRFLWCCQSWYCHYLARGWCSDWRKYLSKLSCHPSILRGLFMSRRQAICKQQNELHFLSSGSLAPRLVAFWLRLNSRCLKGKNLDSLCLRDVGLTERWADWDGSPGFCVGCSWVFISYRYSFAREILQLKKRFMAGKKKVIVAACRENRGSKPTTSRMHWAHCQRYLL